MEDKELIKKYHLEEAKKRFQQICEYTFITSPMLDEDDDDSDNMEDNSNSDMDNKSDNMNQNAPDDSNSSDGNSLGNNSDEMKPLPDSNTGNEDEPIGDDNMENVPDDGMQDNDMQVDDVQDDSVDTDSMQPDDEVIDVDDLTKSQEESEYKIDGVNDKLAKLLNVVNKFTTALEQNDKKINDLKDEFEKRNPTEEELLNLRSQSSYPYSVKPKEYWDNKKKDGNYDIMYNNDVSPDKEQEEFKFRKSDLKGMDDRMISNSLDDDLKLKNYINF